MTGGRNRIEAKPLNWHHLEWVALNMREIDRIEIFGNMPTDNPLEVAAIVMHATAKKGLGWTAWLNNRPVGALGVFEQWPGNWQIWSFGTDDYRRAAVVFKAKFDNSVEYMLANGGHRLQCYSHQRHVESHRLLTFLGATREATLHHYGRDGAAYHVFAWTWESANVPRRIIVTGSDSNPDAAASVEDG